MAKHTFVTPAEIELVRARTAICCFYIFRYWETLRIQRQALFSLGKSVNRWRIDSHLRLVRILRFLTIPLASFVSSLKHWMGVPQNCFALFKSKRCQGPWNPYLQSNGRRFWGRKEGEYKRNQTARDGAPETYSEESSWRQETIQTTEVGISQRRKILSNPRQKGRIWKYYFVPEKTNNRTF